MKREFDAGESSSSKRTRVVAAGANPDSPPNDPASPVRAGTVDMLGAVVAHQDALEGKITEWMTATTGWNKQQYMNALDQLNPEQDRDYAIFIAMKLLNGSMFHVLLGNFVAFRSVIDSPVNGKPMPFATPPVSRNIEFYDFMFQELGRSEDVMDQFILTQFKVADAPGQSLSPAVVGNIEEEPDAEQLSSCQRMCKVLQILGITGDRIVSSTTISPFFSKVALSYLKTDAHRVKPDVLQGKAITVFYPYITDEIYFQFS